MADMLSTLTTWGQPARMSRLQQQRQVFCPRVLRLLLSFEGTMVLNAYVFLLYRWEREVWSAIEIASFVYLLGKIANWSGSMFLGLWC